MIISTSAALIETASLRLSRSLHWGCLDSLHWGWLNSLHCGCLNSLHWGCLNSLHWGCLNSHFIETASRNLCWGCLKTHLLRLPQEAFIEASSIYIFIEASSRSVHWGSLKKTLLRLPHCIFIVAASLYFYWGCLKNPEFRFPQYLSLRLIHLSIKALTSQLTLVRLFSV